MNIAGHLFTLSIDEKPNVPTIGITNECEDNMFRLFADYDNVDYEKVCKDLYHINKVFGLCSFVILVNSEEQVDNIWGGTKTIGNYLVFGFDRLTYFECLNVQNHMRCDRLHKRCATIWSQRNWVNRISAKYKKDKYGIFKEIRPTPKVKDVIKFPGECRYEHCRAQYKFFRKWFKIPELKLKNWDQCSTVEIVEYSTKVKKRRK